jgi:hypothetical protein
MRSGEEIIKGKLEVRVYYVIQREVLCERVYELQADCP